MQESIEAVGEFVIPGREATILLLLTSHNSPQEQAERSVANISPGFALTDGAPNSRYRTQY